MFFILISFLFDIDSVLYEGLQMDLVIIDIYVFVLMYYVSFGFGFLV